MTITLDSKADTDTATSGTSLTVSLTVADNDDRILIVGAGSYNLNPTVSGITYGGVSLTQGVTSNGTDTRAGLWYLINPSVGTANIVCTWSSTAGRRSLGGYSFYGVDQSNPIGVTNDVDGESADNIAGRITPTTTGSMIVDSFAWQAGASTVVSTLTEGWANFIGGNDRWGGSQYNLTPTIGSQNNMNWTGGDAGAYDWVGMEIKPVSIPNQKLEVMFYPDGNVQDGPDDQEIKIMFYPDGNVQDVSVSSATWKWWVGMRYGTRKRYGTSHIRRMRI